MYTRLDDDGGGGGGEDGDVMMVLMIYYAGDHVSSKQGHDCDTVVRMHHACNISAYIIEN